MYEQSCPNYLAEKFSRRSEIHRISTRQSSQLNILRSHQLSVSGPSPTKGQSFGMASVIMLNLLTQLTSGVSIIIEVPTRFEKTNQLYQKEAFTPLLLEGSRDVHP